MKLYTDRQSRVTHRLALASALMRLRPMWIDVHPDSGVCRSSAFLRMSPLGRLPVLDDQGAVVWSSAAILQFMAARYRCDSDWMPSDALGMARVCAWMTTADHAFPDGQHDRGVGSRMVGLLQAMDIQLVASTFIAGSRPTVADIALYSDIRSHWHLRSEEIAAGTICPWMTRIEALPGFRWCTP
jgi:glutathione S-transferase